MHFDHDELLTRLSEYIAFTPDAITPAEVHAMTGMGHSPEEAYLTLLADLLGLEAPGPLNRMVTRHDPARYEADAYFQAVKPAIGVAAGVDLVYERIKPMELFVADDFRRDESGRILPRLGWFDRTFTFPAIREDDQVWMTVTPNEINTIQPAVGESRGRVLTCGLGLGYYAFHCLLKDEVESVTVVEKSPAVIDVFMRRLLPFFPRQEDLHIIQADAFAYAENVMPRKGFDTVFTDLWRDVMDGVPLYQQMKALEVPGPRYLYWMEETLRCYMA